MLHPEFFINIKKQKSPEQKWLPLFLPWSGTLAHKYIISLKSSIPNDFACVTFAYSTTKLRNLLPSFSTTPTETQPEHRFLHSNLVYKYTCPCQKIYIGETERRLAVRIEEHIKSKKSAIHEHTIECAKSSQVQREHFSIVAKRLKH